MRIELYIVQRSSIQIVLKHKARKKPKKINKKQKQERNNKEEKKQNSNKKETKQKQEKS